MQKVLISPHGTQVTQRLLGGECYVPLEVDKNSIICKDEYGVILEHKTSVDSLCTVYKDVYKYRGYLLKKKEHVVTVHNGREYVAVYGYDRVKTRERYKITLCSEERNVFCTYNIPEVKVVFFACVILETDKQLLFSVSVNILNEKNVTLKGQVSVCTENGNVLRTWENMRLTSSQSTTLCTELLSYQTLHYADASTETIAYGYRFSVGNNLPACRVFVFDKKEIYRGMSDIPFTATGTHANVLLGEPKVQFTISRTRVTDISKSITFKGETHVFVHESVSCIFIAEEDSKCILRCNIIDKALLKVSVAPKINLENHLFWDLLLKKGKTEFSYKLQYYALA